MRLVETAELRALVEMIEEDVHKKGWEQQATLWLLRFEALDKDGTGMLMAGQFPGYELLSAVSENSVYALQHLLGAWRVCPAKDRPPIDGIIGLVLVDEAWMLESAHELEPEKSIEEHPDRIEERIAVTVGVDLSVSMLARARDREPGFSPCVGHGRMVDVLVELMSEFTGNTPQAKARLN